MKFVILKFMLITSMLMMTLPTYVYPVQIDTMIDTTVTVPNFEFYTIIRDVDITGKENIELIVTISVSDGEIGFYLMDSDGYTSWEEEYSKDAALYRADDVRELNHRISIHSSGTYYFVLDNTEGWFTPRTVHISVDVSYDVPLSYQEISGIPIMYIIYAVIGIAVLVSIVAISYRYGRRRASYPPPPTPRTSIRTCPGCGATMPEQSVVCPKCGKGF